MVDFNDIEQVGQIDGVKAYILVNEKGKIIFQNIEAPEKMAHMISVCLKNAFAIAKNRLKYIYFPLPTKNDIYIFPVGRFGLGVVKHQKISNMVFVQKIIQFLNKLVHP
ncbi:MAG: hypothetical protein KKE62_16555 [Proteobacteria bacterium]|nr:hypothetical protein [Pseudomonadota bacterium]MBU1389578.1 hypothetical protein [Pseudomonadota bacterium]MBU1544442.1 hypothetical protein [Pseudomonadota bacterium]MBU2481287.1 hypothetical protein [Pseudomonadota bacterium]